MSKEISLAYLELIEESKTTQSPIGLKGINGLVTLFYQGKLIELDSGITKLWNLTQEAMKGGQIIVLGDRESVYFPVQYLRTIAMHMLSNTLSDSIKRTANWLREELSEYRDNFFNIVSKQEAVEIIEKWIDGNSAHIDTLEDEKHKIEMGIYADSRKK